MSDQENGTDRFAESTNLQYGVVEDTIDLDDVHLTDETTVVVNDWPSGGYVLSTSYVSGQGDVGIHFDQVRYDDGVLWFEKSLGDEWVTTGNLDWHPTSAGHYLGLVGEWLLEQIDLDEYRTSAECPECGGTVLSFREFSGCEEVGCDFATEGVIVDG